jgi:hypothetical protein
MTWLMLDTLCISITNCLTEADEEVDAVVAAGHNVVVSYGLYLDQQIPVGGTHYFWADTWQNFWENGFVAVQANTLLNQSPAFLWKYRKTTKSRQILLDGIQYFDCGIDFGYQLSVHENNFVNFFVIRKSLSVKCLHKYGRRDA